MYNIADILDTIICGNVLTELKQMPNECVDTVCCSPPYWGLRSYSTNPQIWGGSTECEHEWGDELPARGKSNWNTWDKYETYHPHHGHISKAKANTTQNTNGAYCQPCGAWRGELGLEPTFNLYIEHLLTIFDEIKRVLKKTGTCWVDIGDTYNNRTKNRGNWHLPFDKHRIPVSGLDQKSLCNIPHRFAIGMTDRGWIQRNTIIWHKPSCMPSSAKDRFTVDFEYVFLFVKNKKYWFEQQFEAQSDNPITQYKNKVYDCNTYKQTTPKYDNNPDKLKETAKAMFHGGGYKNRTIPNGRNKRAVWRINPQPFKDAHFAVFPEKLVEPMIFAGCPSLVCDNCGKPYENKTEVSYTDAKRGYVGNQNKKITDKMVMHASRENDKRLDKHVKKIGSYPTCDCNAPTHPGIVLDPFVGSGTTALVARKLGRHYIGIDLQSDYVDMARKRLAEVL